MTTKTDNKAANVMAVRPAAEVRAEVEGIASRVEEMFAELTAELSRLQGVMHADGFLPDRRKENRNV